MKMSNTNETLKSLAATISEATDAISSALESNNHPQPSFAEDGPLDYPKDAEMVALRFKLIDATLDLYRLSMGPTDMAYAHPLHLNYDAMTLDTFNQFNFWDAVPLGGSATIADIAQKTTLPPSLIRRLLAYSIPSRIFAHGPPGSDTVVHTSLSACFAKKPLFSSLLTHNLEDVRAAAVAAPEAFRRYSAGRAEESGEMLESGFAVADPDRLGRPSSFWEFMDREGEGRPEGFRVQTFARSMQAIASVPQVRKADVLRDGYDWSSLGEATVIDVGGSSGHDALVVTRAFPKLRFVVQDLPKVEAEFRETVPEAEASRIQFEARDFFGPQESKADVYLLKLILHDWSDKYAMRILSPLLPHLKSGSRLLLVEGIVPPTEAPLPPSQRRLLAAIDFQMLCILSALERSLDQWRALIGKVDPGLQITYVSDVPGSIHNFIEVKYLA